jgi:hypothetical protein
MVAQSPIVVAGLLQPLPIGTLRRSLHFVLRVAQQPGDLGSILLEETGRFAGTMTVCFSRQLAAAASTGSDPTRLWPDRQWIAPGVRQNTHPLVATDYIVDELMMELSICSAYQRDLGVGPSFFNGDVCDSEWVTQADAINARQVLIRPTLPRTRSDFGGSQAGARFCSPDLAVTTLVPRGQIVAAAGYWPVTITMRNRALLLSVRW